MTQPSPEPLEFDTAQFDQPAAGATCGQCKRAIPDRYYEANGVVLCERCKKAMEAAWNGGSAARRFFRALAFGGAGAAAGAVVWFLVAKFTGYELGLIAILVGFLAGKGVLMGSDHHGGRGYQVLAVLLSYLAIASTYTPTLVAEWDKMAAQEASATVTQGGEESFVLPRPIVYVVAWVISLAAPVLMGVENIMGLIIIGIALWEAWRLAARRDVSFNGPFEVGAPVYAEVISPDTAARG